MLVPSPRLAVAQPVARQPVVRAEIELETPWLAILREANARGSQRLLTAAIQEFLSDLSQVPLEACCADANAIYQVAFRASEDAGAPLVRVFAGSNGLTRGSLPGISGPGHPLYEIFVSEDLNVALDSAYSSTPQESPLDEQLAQFVKVLLANVALPGSANVIRAAASGARATVPRTEPPLPRYPPLAVAISKLELPDSRAQLTITHTVSPLDPAGHIRSQGRWVADSVLRRAIVESVLGRKPGSDVTPETASACASIALAVEKALSAATQTGDCRPLRADPAKCFVQARSAIETAFDNAVKGEERCSSAAAFPIAQRFLSTVPDKLAEYKGTATVRNVPRTHWSLGLGTAFIAALQTQRDKPRVEISNGSIAVDPFTRPLAMGTVSWVPAGYDPESFRLRTTERLRLFGGAAFAPHFGAVTGVGVALNRYLTANTGYAWLVYDTPKPGETVGEEPSAANRAAPFELAGAHAWFVGVSFNVK
jgi:hypothetical protein